MRKLAVVLAIVAALASSVGTATAHGTCTAKALKPVRSGSTVFFTGSYDCNGTFHDQITVTVYAQRRAGSVTTDGWSSITSVTAVGTNTTVQAAQANLPFDCHKDYRTRTVGTASKPGTTSHSGSANSTILQNTC